jgi:hypothetical protein
VTAQRPLADSGASAAAIEVIWPLEGARALALRWIDGAELRRWRLT